MGHLLTILFFFVTFYGVKSALALEQTGIEVIDGSLGVVDDFGYYYVTASIYFPDSFSKTPMYVCFDAY